MNTFVIPDRATFNRFSSREVVEVRTMLDWVDRGDYVVGAQAMVFCESPGTHNPSLPGEIVEDLGVVEHIVEDNNIHCFKIKRVEPQHAKPPSEANQHAEICTICQSLPDDLTVNTGREERFPAAVNELINMDRESGAAFRCCPGCRTYFQWIDMPQMYGTGNNAEERLVRLSSERSHLLDKIFTADSTYRANPDEIERYLKTLPLDHLLPALNFWIYRHPEIVRPFVPALVRLLNKNKDDSLRDMLQNYVRDDPKRADELLHAFIAGGDDAPSPLTQVLRYCLKVVQSKK